ncbi:DUF2530 domain-containing protein [Cellulomonas sp. PhB150]|uniref:DUF2530 domain-containing protein n=1 Tax=Cellulomonas sp. PhB150 TaxID=2485188 RepID=UPI000FA66363|nr:DUF2530 domain-containing protein [Cellulomonas sp. PhB150]ROS25799.1 uncharacterized protein DUF2530 [Cellulomonas sp. PhB150]
MASPSRRRSPDDAPVAPLDVDLGRVMTIGTGLWLVALVVAAVLWLTDTIGGIPVAVCATGAVLGVVGWDWARRHRTTTES